MPGGRFLPAPADVAADVLAALSGPVLAPDDPALAALLARIEGPLRRLFRTERPVLIGAASATVFMEAAIRCGVEQRVLVVVGGSDGERFAGVAEACGKEAIRLFVPPGRTVEPDHLARFLDGPEVDAVALVHSEASTGALAPLEELARVVRGREDVLLLVDASGSMGGLPVETDRWELDFVFTGSQQALALPAGLALGVASERLLARARAIADRGWYADLVRLAAAAATAPASAQPALAGPAVPQLYALAAQLERIEADGGIEARWRRHQELLQCVERWALEHPELPLLAPAGRRSWTVSALQMPDGASARTRAAALRERGWIVATGLPPLEDRLLRIGHQGEVTPAELDALLAGLSAERSKQPGV